MSQNNVGIKILKGTVDDITLKIEEKIKTIEELNIFMHDETLKSLQETKKEAEKNLVDHILHSTVLAEHLQYEILTIQRDLEVIEKFTQEYIALSWFTKTFRKNYVKTLYKSIHDDVFNRFSSLTEESRKRISSAQKLLADFMKEQEKDRHE